MALYIGNKIVAGSGSGQNHILCSKQQYLDWLNSGQIQDKKIYCLSDDTDVGNEHIYCTEEEYNFWKSKGLINETIIYCTDDN